MMLSGNIALQTSCMEKDALGVLRFKTMKTKKIALDLESVELDRGTDPLLKSQPVKLDRGTDPLPEAQNLDSDLENFTCMLDLTYFDP